MQGVFQFGVGADQGDLQVVGPAAGGEFDGDRGEHLAGGVVFAADGEGAEVFEVEQHMSVFLVVSDGDEARVRGRDVRGVVEAGEVVDVGGQGPYGGVGGAGPRWREGGGIGEVEVELCGGEPGGAYDGQRLLCLGAVGGEAA